MVVGQKVEHKLSKDWVMILEIDGNRVLCRTKDLATISFYLFELQEIRK